MKFSTISSLTVAVALVAFSEASPRPLDSITPCSDSNPSSSSGESTSKLERRDRYLPGYVPASSTQPRSEYEGSLEPRDRYLPGYVQASSAQPRGGEFDTTPLADRDDSGSDADSEDADGSPSRVSDPDSDSNSPTPVDLNPRQNAPSSVPSLHKSWKCQNFDSYKWSDMPLFRKSQGGLVQGGPIFKCRYVKDTEHPEGEHHTCTYKTKNGDPVWNRNSRRCPDHAKWA
ncbi:hypothetical protein C8J56DRAFT_1098853 [Mycena floridula]|nr:hypothetical protein C8J56DRAFT_1098853 [Mycena floridula]